MRKAYDWPNLLVSKFDYVSMVKSDVICSYLGHGHIVKQGFWPYLDCFLINCSTILLTNSRLHSIQVGSPALY